MLKKRDMKLGKGFVPSSVCFFRRLALLAKIQVPRNADISIINSNRKTTGQREDGEQAAGVICAQKRCKCYQAKRVIKLQYIMPRHCLERRHLIPSPSLVVHVAVLSVARQENAAPVYVAAATNAQSSLPPPTSFLW